MSQDKFDTLMHAIRTEMAKIQAIGKDVIPYVGGIHSGLLMAYAYGLLIADERTAELETSLARPYTFTPKEKQEILETFRNIRAIRDSRPTQEDMDKLTAILNATDSPQ